ncbi:two component transcriptional regulator, LuxR family [Xylanimonas cellulosilytica DSM 15894]|uniref:Two component transcriptional regulator, LuxR family n=1 Tax=Xylanimonas cellulosilytica (strain DSM 15894 / JCM 12276 / CECT 5975 / KCTC 9989 / LMG 20990 / NBRC 107835 / XIL07) TaxID=446471 RepID=D1BSG4_XYLCX|nr:response regulator transcription factor [Xylanimonas cellulosilytica]ACZ30656.1 two component transcriptional regulator, LuxR family [Xylanimonas cellulosilytica DSM 15894]
MSGADVYPSGPGGLDRDGREVSVLVVDDQDLVRAGFRLILERAGIEVLGEAADGAQAVEQVAALRPDVVLMDVRMPHLDGIEATRRILARAGTAVRVIVLTTFDLDEYVYGAIRAGASGYLLKDVSPRGLVTAVRAVADGEAMLSPAVLTRMLDQYVARPPAGVALPPAIAALTDREREVARNVARGLSNAQIAARLFLSEATVKTYVSRLLTKLGLRDRVQIAVLAYETGLVRVGERAED